MLLNDLVETSRRVGRRRAGSPRSAISPAAPPRLADEIDIAVSYLSGEVRQGRIGVGYAALPGRGRDAALGAVADARPRSMPRSARIMTTRGSGSAAERRRLLAELFGQATRAEQEFLFLLLIGELRQGALEGVMVEAIARAAELPVAEIRRAVMVSGQLAPVAEAALTEGRSGLAPLRDRGLPPAPADAGADRGGCRRRAPPLQPGELRIQARRRAGPGPQGRQRGPHLHPRTERRDRCRAGDRRGGRGAGGRQPHSRRRGDLVSRRRHAAALPGDDAPIRTQARRGGDAGHPATQRRSSSIA